MDGTRPAPRLSVLHRAGGSSMLYRHRAAGLPDTWDVRLLDAPGRGFLLGLPRIDDAGLLADFPLRGIEPDLTCPYALFGRGRPPRGRGEPAERTGRRTTDGPEGPEEGVPRCRLPRTDRHKHGSSRTRTTLRIGERR
jgi:hypothetical protein